MSDSSSGDEIAAAIILAECCRERQKLKRRKARRWWSITMFRNREKYGMNTILRDLYMEKRSGKIENFLRMSDEDFHFLLNLIAPMISKQDTVMRKAISAKERFLVTLRFLATGESYEDLQYLSRISPQSLSTIIIEICQALIKVLAPQMQMPSTPDGWKKIAEKFEEETYFRNCIGAIDGRHMAIQNPEGAGSMYHNYKGFFSIVLLVLCDSNYCFTYANVGCQGRISDGGVFNQCSLAQKLEENTLNLPPPEPLATGRKPVLYVIVADNAFALKEHMMNPYSGEDSKILGSPQRIFNYRLSSARSRIENTFGIFTCIFRIFRKPMMLDVKKARTVVECAVMLHNFLRRSRTSSNTYSPGSMFDSYIKEDGVPKLVPGTWRSDLKDLTSSIPLRKVARRPAGTPKEIREEFASFYSSEQGRVPWQEYLQ